jgi:phytoene/squalene synthetase
MRMRRRADCRPLLAAQVPDNVHQETLLHIRMQWWRDAIKSAYSDKPQPHPVVLALKEVRAGACLGAAAGSLDKP